MLIDETHVHNREGGYFTGAGGGGMGGEEVGVEETM